MTIDNSPNGHAVVVGAGPAGLMAAETLARSGVSVTICEHKPSVGRKFLMAGKSGLNLTKIEDDASFLNAFTEAKPLLQPMLAGFDSVAIQKWAEDLGQTLFTGSTGRVFPTVMKASPLLRAWLARLAGAGVQINTRWQWTGWHGTSLAFATPQGQRTLGADVTVLALGGASWARLGSTGEWATILRGQGIDVAAFEAANAGVAVNWSSHMAPHFGAALKGIALRSGAHRSRGEAIIATKGLEGGGIYAVSRGVRDGHPLVIDLLPDQSVEALIAKLDRPRGRMSVSNYLRKAVKLDAAKIGLLQELARPLPQDSRVLAELLKALSIKNAKLRPLDEAISTAGGIPFAAVDETLMLNARPDVFVAGEMLDWEAPTGGYLLSACLATGRWAGQHAAARVRNV